MSLISNAMAKANAIVAAAKGEALAYRVNDQLAWVTLTGFVLERDDVIPPAYDEIEHAEVTARTARLSGPLSPALAAGYEVRDGNGDTWAVVTAELDQQQLCALRLSTVDNAGADRGGAS